MSETQRESASTSPAGGTSARLRWTGGAVAGGLILAIGLYGGWLTGRAGSGGAAPRDEHEGAPEESEVAAQEGAPGISPQTLQNIGAEFGDLVLSDYVRTREIASVVEDRPDGRRAVYAPVGGRVVRVHVRTGQVLRAGEPVAEIARSAFPRPSLTLTDTLLKPLNEDYHRSVGDLRSAALSLQLAREELDRVRKVLRPPEGSTALPSKVEIDLAYEERRSQRALESARVEARRHGLTDPEIEAIEAGTQATADQPPARRILDRNRLWSPDASDVLDALPSAVRDLPYTTAVLGELVGAHALSPDLVALVKSRPPVAAAFLDIAGLLQQGATASEIQALDEAGALAPRVVVRAPEDAPDWDVSEVAVRAGAQVEAGADLAVLSDERTLFLRAAPTAADVGLLEGLLRAEGTVTAEPLADGAGPRLSGLCCYRLAESQDGGSLASALFVVANSVVKETSAEGAPRTRTWALRAGTRYSVRVPVQSLPGRFVLPAAAIVPRGPDSVLVLREGTRRFRLVPVHVEHADSTTAVVANDGAVFAGDTVALRGAYALSLALQAGTQGAAASHAGHNH